MVITYYGKQYFKLTLGEMTIATNPVSKSSKSLSKAPRFGADIALVSLNHPDYNGVETVTLGDKEPFLINSAGSYEVRELFFTGANSKVSVDGKEFYNAVYGFELDNIKICFLGAAHDDKTMSTEAKEIAGLADIVFISIAEDPARAYKSAMLFDPNMIIPMDFDEESLARFLKEGAQEGNIGQDKLTLKRRDLDGKEGFIAVLNAQS